MSFNTIWVSYQDQALVGRVTACCASEGESDPQTAAHKVMWPVVTASDIEAAYASAVASNNQNPGGDETVITDQMILSHVQAALV